MNTHPLTACASPVLAFNNKASRRLSLSGLWALWRSRRALATLTSDQLCDIGVSSGDAATEASRPIWDVPAHWRD